MKLMVYSHDAFGLGNIRRMLTICEYLLRTLPSISILVVSGSPALHTLRLPEGVQGRSEEHTSELQSPVPISYAVFCLKKKKKTKNNTTPNTHCKAKLKS